MDPTLKKLLATAKALVPHTGPLTYDKVELCQRLKIDASTSHSVEYLRILVGNKCLELLVGMHKWLEKEYWTPEASDGLVVSDFLLGTADMRTIRALCDQTITLLLLPLSQLYRDELLVDPQPENGPLKSTLVTILNIMTTHHPPSPSAGPSTRTSLPHTSVAVSMTKHLGFIVLSTILLAYTPTCPPEVHADLRKQSIVTMDQFPPSVTIPQMNRALVYFETGKNMPQERSESWKCRWPMYMRNYITNRLSGQFRRPGGIKAFMVWLLDEDDSLKGAANIIAKAACAHPARTPIQEWLPQCIDSLLQIISPSSHQATPLIYVHTACYAIHHVWSIQREHTSAYLDRVISRPIAQSADILGDENPSNDLSPSLRRSVATLFAIIQQTPYDPDYLDSLVHPILRSLLTLMGRYQVSHPVFSHQIRHIVGSWVEDADKEQVINAIGSITGAGPEVGEDDLASIIALPDESSEL